MKRNFRMEHGVEAGVGFSIHHVCRNEELRREVLFNQAVHVLDDLGKVPLDRRQVVLEVAGRGPLDVDAIEIRVIHQLEHRSACGQLAHVSCPLGPMFVEGLVRAAGEFQDILVFSNQSLVPAACRGIGQAAGGTVALGRGGAMRGSVDALVVVIGLIGVVLVSRPAVAVVASPLLGASLGVRPRGELNDLGRFRL